MKTYIALFRGINVSGKNLLPMKALTSCLEGVGASEVKTYIQSGNAVFKRSPISRDTLATEIRAAIKRSHNIEPPVIILGPEQLDAAVADNPFPEAAATPNMLHLFFLERAPPSPNLAKLESLKSDSERFELQADRFYLHAPDGIGRSKLAAGAEKALGVPATARNWRTVLTIQTLARALA